MPGLALIVLVAVVAVGALVAQRRRQGAPPVAAPRGVGAPAESPGSGWSREGDRVRLAVEVDAARLPALEALARRVAQEVLALDPDARAITVIDRVGRTVVEVARSAVGPATPGDAPGAAPSDTARATPGPRPHVPSPVPRGDRARHAPAGRGDGTEAPGPLGRPVPARAFADRFALPAAVRAACEDPDHPAEVVRAILAAAGRPAERRGDLVVSGPVAVAVADVRDDAATALSRAYLRITSSGAQQGLVLVLGFVDPQEVRRRDRLAEGVRYVDEDALQRMADAVAAGLDPVAFAAPPRASGTDRTVGR